MSYHDLPEIKKRETEIKIIDLKLIKLKAQYMKAALMRHFPEDLKLPATN